MKHAVRVGLAIAGALIAVVAIVVGGAIAISRTDWGARLTARSLAHWVNRTIAGRLAVGSFSFRGDHLVLKNVALYDPRGNLVARAPRVGIAFRPSALLHRHVDVSELDLDRPLVRLAPAADGKGLELSRALARRSAGGPAKAKAKSGGGQSRWSIDVRHLGIIGGVIDDWSHPLPAGGAPPLEQLSDLRVSARAHYEPSSDAFQVELDATGGAKGIAPGRLAIASTARGRGGLAHAEASLVFGDTLRAEAHFDDGRGVVELDRLHIPPTLARAIVPGYPLRVPVDARLKISLASGRASGWALVTAAGGTLRVEGDVDPRALTTENGIRVEGHDLDLGKLLRSPVDRAPLDLAVDVQPGSLRSAGIAAQARASVARGRVNGQSLGPVHLRARVAEGRLAALRLLADVPGLRVSARAHGPLGHVEGRATVVAGSLGRAARALASAADRPPPTIAGRARLTVRVAGAVGNGARALDRLSVEGTAPELKLGGTTLAGLTFGVGLRGADAGGPRPIAFHVRLQQPKRLGLSASGTLAPDRRSMTATSLSLDYPGATWTATGPARVSFGNGRQAVEGLRLAAPHHAQEQRISLDLARSGEHLHARLALDDVRLAALPPRLRRARGDVSGKLRVDGTVADPSVDLDLQVRDISAPAAQATTAAEAAAADQVATVGLQFRYQDANAHLVFDVQGAGGGKLEATAEARADLGWPAAKQLGGGRWKRLPVEGRLVGHDFAVGWIAGFVPSIARLGGRLDADAHLVGRLGNPHLVGDIRWRKGTIVVKPPSASRGGGRAHGGAEASGSSRSAARNTRSGSSPSFSTVP